MSVPLSATLPVGRLWAAELPAVEHAPSRSAEDRLIWQAFRHHSRTFSLAARLLPRHVQLPIATLYLYCRSVDTLADSRAVTVGTDQAMEDLGRVRRELELTLVGKPPPEMLWRRLHEVHSTFDLTPEPLFELLDGAQWDIESRPIRTTAELIAYSDRVAGSVGAMMLPFLVADRSDIPVLEQSARALGNAMQITNILRDVGEDWRTLGRVYLPADALLCRGIQPAEFDHSPTPRYTRLVEEVMALAERLYDEAEDGIDGLAPGGPQRGIRAAARMYREILNEVRAANYDNLGQRAVVTLQRKLRLLVHDDYARRRDHLRCQSA